MQLKDFNTVGADEAAALVRACADVERWVDEIVAGRPYASVADVVAAAARPRTHGPTRRSTPPWPVTRASATAPAARAPTPRCRARSRRRSPTPTPRCAPASPRGTAPTR